MSTVVHLFAGSGGCTLGFQRAGFHSLGSIDCDAKACRDLERLTGGNAIPPPTAEVIAREVAATLRSTATAGFLVGGDVWLQPEEAAAT